MYSYLCRFLSFPLFFSLSLSFSFSFLCVSQVAGPYGIFFFSFSVRLSASKLPRSPINSNFFFIRFFFLWSFVRCWLPLSVVPRQLSAARLSAVQRQLPPSQVASSTASLASPSHFRIRRDFRSKNPLSGFAPKQKNESSALAAHPHSNTFFGGVTKSRKDVLQHYMHVRTIASVGYLWKFHKATGIRLILTHCRWTLSSLLLSPESGVDCLYFCVCYTPILCCSPLCCPTPTASLLGHVVNSPRPGPPSTASLASPSHFRIRRDFMSKNPLSGFAPKQTIESSALAAHPHSATLLLVL